MGAWFWETAVGWGQELHAQHLALEGLCRKGWLAGLLQLSFFPDTNHILFFADTGEMALVTIQWFSKS